MLGMKGASLEDLKPSKKKSYNGRDFEQEGLLKLDMNYGRKAAECSMHRKIELGLSLKLREERNILGLCEEDGSVRLFGMVIDSQRRRIKIKEE